MKIGAGGLQAQVTHEEVAGRQAQEAKRTDYQQKPAVESETAAALNRHALNKTVEKNSHPERAYNTPRQVRNRDRENRRGTRQDSPGGGENRSSPGEQPGPRDFTKVHAGGKVDRYI